MAFPVPTAVDVFLNVTVPVLALLNFTTLSALAAPPPPLPMLKAEFPVVPALKFTFKVHFLLD
jgi:hypothetical protein